MDRSGLDDAATTTGRIVLKNHPSQQNRRRYRTRRDILRAASQLARKGEHPSMEAIAEEAMVSRATIYRYFTNIEELLYEASVDIEVPAPDLLFSKSSNQDPVERLDQAEAALHKVLYANEKILRHLLASALVKKVTGSSDSIPTRQNRRIPLIQAALEPVRSELSEEEFDRLCSALALVFGPESMIVFQDVVPMSSKKSRKIKRWIIKSLVEASLENS